MLLNCKNCGKQLRVTGKQQFCDSKCKDAFRYKLKTGKLNKGKPGECGGEKHLIGQVSKVMTTLNGKIRIHIDAALDTVDFDLFSHLNKKTEMIFGRTFPDDPPKRRNRLLERYGTPQISDVDDLFD